MDMTLIATAQGNFADDVLKPFLAALGKGNDVAILVVVVLVIAALWGLDQITTIKPGSK